MYIFKYKTKDGDIGYHLDTWCNVGERNRAKHYTCTSKTVDEQKKVILTNLKSILSADINSTDSWERLRAEYAQRNFPSLSFGDIELVEEEVEDVELVYITQIIE